MQAIEVEASMLRGLGVEGVFWLFGSVSPTSERTLVLTLSRLRDICPRTWSVRFLVWREHQRSPKTMLLSDARDPISVHTLYKPPLLLPTATSPPLCSQQSEVPFWHYQGCKEHPITGWNCETFLRHTSVFEMLATVLRRAYNS